MKKIRRIWKDIITERGCSPINHKLQANMLKKLMIASMFLLMVN